MHKCFKFSWSIILLLRPPGFLYFGDISKKSLPNPVSWSLSLMLSSWSFVVLGVQSNLELIFVCGIRFMLFRVVIQSSQHHLLQKLSFPHCVLWAPLSKTIWSEAWGFISKLPVLFHCLYVSLFCSIVCMSFFMPVSHCFVSCSFKICEIRKCQAFNLYLLFKIVLVFQGPVRISEILEAYIVSVFVFMLYLLIRNSNELSVWPGQDSREQLVADFIPDALPLDNQLLLL